MFTVDSLKEYDVTLCSLLSSLLNVAVVPSSPSWSQASLPIRLGGLGFRSAVQLAPSCYLSLAAASCGLVSLILSKTAVNTVTITSQFFDDALASWSAPFLLSCPQLMIGRLFKESGTIFRLKLPLTISSALLQMIALVQGYWQSQLQSQVRGFMLYPSPLGLRLDDVSVHISVALRLGLPVCAPHACKHCGTSVSSFCLHSLFCKRGSMRFHWHAALNDVILRSLSSAGYSCLLGAFGPLEIRW